MFAVMKTGGRQYVVVPGQKLKIEKLPQSEGDKIVFEDVLLVSDGEKLSLGFPVIAGAKISAIVRRQAKYEKQIVFKMRPKKRYRVKLGHRQPYTEVEITNIALK